MRILTCSWERVIFGCTCGLEKSDSHNPIGHKPILPEWNNRRLCARRCDGAWSRCPRLPFQGYNEQRLSCAAVHRGSWAQASPWRCSRSRDRNTSIGRSRQPPVSFRYFTFDHNTPGGKLSRQPQSWLLSPILSCCRAGPPICVHFHGPPDIVEMLCSGELGFSHIQDVSEKEIQHPRLLSVHPQAQEIGQ